MLARSLQPAPPPGEPRRIGNVEIRPEELQVLVNGQRAGLTVREFEILYVLADRMAIRDHFRLDVLTRKAARLQELDARLAAIERLLKLESEGAAGACPECGALYARGASFCWQCGAGLTQILSAR